MRVPTCVGAFSLVLLLFGAGFGLNSSASSASQGPAATSSRLPAGKARIVFYKSGWTFLESPRPAKHGLTRSVTTFSPRESSQPFVAS